MSVELWVDSVSIERWGRASGMRVRLAARDECGGFFVVCGPNESGKTSFATALAWLIAGAGNQGVLQRFGKPDEVLAASFRGSLGGEALRAGVEVKVTRQREGASAEGQEKFQAELSGESLRRVEFQQRLGGGDFVGYRNFYWLEAFEVAESEGIKETLSVKAMFGGIDPDGEAERLEREAGDRIGRRSNTPRSAWMLLREAEKLRSQIAELGGEWQRLAEVEEGLERIESELAAAQESRTELSKQDKSTQLALGAVESGLLERRNQARKALREAAEPSPEERRIHGQASQLLGAAAKLGAAEEELRCSKAEHRSAEARVPAGWRALISEAPIDKSALAEARQASANLAAHRSEAERAGGDLGFAKDDFLGLVKRLQLLEDKWHEAAPGGLSPSECTPAAADKLLQQSKRQRLGVLTAAVLGLVVAVVEAAIGGGMRAWGIAAGLIVVGAALALGAWWRKGWREARAVAALSTSEETHTILDLRRKLEDAQKTEEQAARGESAAAERLNEAQAGFESLLLRLGVNADLIGEDAHDSVAQLEAVAEAQQAARKLEKASAELAEVRSGLNGLLAGAAVLTDAEALSQAPSAVLGGAKLAGAAGAQDVAGAAGAKEESSAEPRAFEGGENSGVSPVHVLADADAVGCFLQDVSTRVGEHERLRQEAKEAGDDLLRALRGDKAAEKMVEQKSVEELRADSFSLQSELKELGEQLTDLDARGVDLRAQRKSLESAGSREDMELARGELATRIEEKLVSGLGYRLAAELLRRAVETHRKTRRPALISRTEGLVREASDWTSVTGNPHSPEKEGDLIVESARGEHSSRRLSLGAQSLLYLTLRLATIEEQAEARGVRLPLILDDVLVGIDEERLDGCLGVLSRFADRHQVILLTCHERLAERARSAGAVLLDWPPSGQG